MKKSITPDLYFTTVNGKRISARFDDPAVSSDGGALFLREVDGQTGLMDRLAQAITDGRRQSHVTHQVVELLRQRTYQISCGYEDANDCDTLREDPVFRTAVGHDPSEDGALGSQPTMTRLENAVGVRDLLRLGYAFVDHFIASYARPPRTIVLDMDPTSDTVYGDQQLALFNGYEDEYCFMPFHVYEGQSGKLITSVLRSGKTPTAQEILSILKRIIRRVRAAWPEVNIIFRADSHHTKPEVMEWLEANKIHYITGLTPNQRLKKLFETFIRTAEKKYREQKQMGHPVRVYTSQCYAAKSWSCTRRVVCRILVSAKGTDVRYVVTSFQEAGAKYLYETAYCGRGKMELMIKDHKVALRSDRTSCHRKEANQFRLFLHSAAYVLMHALRTYLLKGTELARAQFDTIRLRFLKIGTRLEAGRTFLRFHFPAACPTQKILWRASSILTVLDTT
jgi:hypothetical protein